MAIRSIGAIYGSSAKAIMAFSAITLCFLSMISFFARHEASMQFNQDTAVQVMFADQSRSVVYGWPEWPVNLAIGGAPSSEDMDAVKLLVSELNAAVEGAAVQILEDATDADIHIVFSPQAHERFEAFYSNMFVERFGQAEFEKWNAIGGFSFPFREETPCFAFGLYNPTNYYKSGYVASNSPDVALIAIGRTRDFGTTTREACIREELAHMVFYIPDFHADSPNDTVFNANALDNAVEDFSNFDLELMRFIYRVPVRHADASTLREQVERYIVDGYEQ